MTWLLQAAIRRRRREQGLPCDEPVDVASLPGNEGTVYVGAGLGQGAPPSGWEFLPGWGAKGVLFGRCGRPRYRRRKR